MSKDLKDLIDQAEEDQQSRAYLEKTVENLQNEIEKLKNKLKSKQTVFTVEPIKHVEEKTESEEMLILKDMISSLREDLKQKGKEKELLRVKAEELTIKLEEANKKLSDPIRNEILSRTQNSLNILIQDYGKLETENKTLKNQLSELRKEIESSSQSLTTMKVEQSENAELKKEIISLKNQISNLETKNKDLIEDVKSIKIKDHSTEELEKLINRLKKNNLELVEENEILSKNIETLKREKIKILKYESKISELNQQIKKLMKNNKKLQQKDTILLAKTITAMQQTEKKQEPKLHTQVPTSRLNDVTKAIEKKIELSKPIKPPIEKKETIKPLNLVEPAPQTERLDLIEAEYKRKWQCPKCGNTNKTQIRETDDRTKLIYAYPKIFAKKYQCGQCGAEWR